MNYKNKLNFREYHLLVDNLLPRLELPVDYVNNLEKDGNPHLFTKGYVVRSSEDLIEKVFGLLGKKDQTYIVKEQEVEFINNVKTRFNVE